MAAIFTKIEVKRKMSVVIIDKDWQYLREFINDMRLVFTNRLIFTKLKNFFYYKTNKTRVLLSSPLL
jgi:hypothetical protein